MGSRHSVAFSFDDEATANQQIEPSVPDGNLLVGKRNGNLSLEGDAPKAELDSQRLFVRELEESGTQLVMDLKRSVNDHSSEIVECLVRFGVFGALGVLAVHVQLSTARTLGCANSI